MNKPFPPAARYSDQVSLVDLSLPAKSSLVRTYGRVMARPQNIIIQRICEMADILIAASLILALFTLANLRWMTNGIEPFLMARVTLSHTIQVVAFLFSFHFMFRLMGVYDPATKRFQEEMPRVLAASSLGTLIALMFPALSRTESFAGPTLLYFWIGATLATLSVRAIRWSLAGYLKKPRQVIIVGSGNMALNLFEDLRDGGGRKYEVLGFVDSPDSHLVPDQIQSQLLGKIENLDEIIMQRVVDHVMIAMPIKSCYDQIQNAIGVCERAGVESEYYSQPFELAVARAQYGSSDNRHPVVRFKVVEDDDSRLAVKRCLDIVGALSGIVLLSPLMILAAIAVKLSSRGPVIFRQERFGLNKRRFHMYKFRSMVQNADHLQSTLEGQNEKAGPIFKIKNDPRITPLGRLLRVTSIDELPQFFNVLSGDMSLVGPRPLPVRDVLRFSDPSSMRRFSVKPGLTCLWQVGGRSNTDFLDWVALDLQYIDNWSLILDLEILLKTIPVVLTGKGAT